MSAQPTVVIADDDNDIRQLIAVAVRKAGAVLIAEAGNGAAALAAVRQSPPDLAILDVSMPELSGLDVCRELRKDPSTSSIRILLLSAAVHPAAIEEGLADGADAYLTKHISPRTLATQNRDLLPAEP
jgi:CheY-like chemotaxis protein